MQNHMFDSLVNNAIDFMQVSLQELKARPKYSVIHFCSGVEIFFKARLLLEHWSLVVAKPEQAIRAAFETGEFRSVTLDQAFSRLENTVNERFSKDAKAALKGLLAHRNKLTHQALMLFERWVGLNLFGGVISATGTRYYLCPVFH